MRPIGKACWAQAFRAWSSQGARRLPDNVFDIADNRFRIGLGRTSLPHALERLDSFVARRS